MKLSRLKLVVPLAFFGLVVAGIGCGDPESEQETPQQEEDDGLDVPETKDKAAEATNNGKDDWAIDICERNDWYGDAACDWFCPQTDPDCQLDPLGPEPSGEPTQYPVVLAHGFMGSDTNFWAFYQLHDELEHDGHQVFETEVPPFDSVATRAELLAEQIDDILADTGAEKVNIIAHSMGGLDSRYLISTLGYSDQVASLTTIATPHYGSYIGDVYIGITPEAADDAVDALAKLAGDTFSEVADETDVRAAMEDISESTAEEFNESNPDAEGVYYQSWAGVSSVKGIRVDGIAEVCDYRVLMHEGTMDRMDPLLWGTAALVAGTSVTLNDGMVAVENAKWGEFQGCIPTDHLDQVGQINDDGADTYTGFDHIRFYRNVVFHLSQMGY